MLRRRVTALTIATLGLVAACTDKGGTSTTSAASSTAATTTTLPADLTVTAGAPFPAARCAANKAAGTVTYLSGFNFTASASIVDVLVAKAKGYYAAMCLDVKLTASFSTANYPIIAANDAQFASGGSFSEMADFAGANDAEYVALAVEGRTGIDALITKDGAVPALADIKGKKIGVKGAITPSVKAMLAKAGLVENTDYQTVKLDGFDPLVHITIPDIVGFPGYKSSEPHQLDAGGVKYKLYNPSDYDIPGSFGVIYTNGTFMKAHPTAAQDFMRATMHGLADAVADPAAAAKAAVDATAATGGATALDAAAETARWKIESGLVATSATAAAPLGLPLVDELTVEVKTYASIGLFDGTAPDISTMVDPAVLKGIYDAKGTVIWPKV